MKPKTAAADPMPARTRVCYIRFGGPPPAGYSYNNRRRRREAGMAVFSAEGSRGDGYAVEVPMGHGFAELVLQAACLIALMARLRPVYEATGTLAGAGGDGEPLLAPGALLRPVPPAAGVYPPGWWGEEGRAFGELHGRARRLGGTPSGIALLRGPALSLQASVCAKIDRLVAGRPGGADEMAAAAAEAATWR